MALTTEVRSIIAQNPTISGPDLAAKMSTGAVQYSRHVALRWLKDYKLEQALAAGTATQADVTANWRPAENREEWFLRVIGEMEGKLKSMGYKLPKVRVGCGFVSGGKRSKAMGEAWRGDRSSDGIHTIFISPRINTAVAAGQWITSEEKQHHEGDCTVIMITFHEYFHSVLWHNECEVHDKAPHGKTFKRLCEAFNMEIISKRGATAFTPAGVEAAKLISERVGPYPMAPLNTEETSAPKTQTTRQVKVLDADDPTYFVRMTRDQIGKKGLPLTPNGTPMVVDPFSALRTVYGQDAVEAEDLAFKDDEGGWALTKKGQRVAAKIIDEMINGKDVAVAA
jgi:hypothetical protein